MDIIEVLLIVAAIALFARFFGFLKGLKIKKNHALIGAICILAITAVAFNWYNLQEKIRGFQMPSGGAEGGRETPGVNWYASGSESDSNLTYDATTRVFTLSYYENLTATAPYTPVSTGGSAITTATLTITLYNDTESTSSDNYVTKISTTIPTFNGKNENANTTYAPVAKVSGTNEYDIALTPSGGSARYEYAFVSAAPGGSKSTSIVVTLSALGLCQLDNFQSKDLYINTAGGNFTLRFLKTGESS